MNKLMMLTTTVFAAAALFAAEPRTIYVDQSVAASGDGTSWATAFKTIQEGVNDASTEVVDTVLVAPGTYGDSDGCVTFSSYKTRVNITKRLNLKSDKGKEVTHIVGHRGDGAGNAVDSTGPVICVRVADDAAKNTVIEGFTIRDGELDYRVGKNSRGPAGVGNPGNTDYGYASSNNFYVVYCTISNCCAQRASAMRGGTAIGTLFSENLSYPYEKGTYDTAMNFCAYNCIFTRSGTVCPGLGAGHACVGYYYEMVNCTLANNRAERGATGSKAYNVAQIANGKGGDNTAGIAINCVYDGSISKKTDTTDTVVMDGTPDAGDYGHDQTFMGAPESDFRPVNGGYLYGKDGHYGNIQYTRNDFIPEKYKQTDFYGNKLADDAVIPIGVILPAGGADKVVPVKVTLPKIYVTIGGKTGVENHDLIINDGKALVSGQYIHSDKPFHQLAITPSWTGSVETVCLRSTVDVGGTKSYPRIYPLRKGDFKNYLYTMLPAQENTANELTEVLADGVYYVDRNNGKDDDDNYAGLTADKAFASLNKATATMPAGSSSADKNYIVHVAEGVYDNNTKSCKSWITDTIDMPARLLLNQKCVCVSFRATGARDKTVIEGAADPDYEDGCGPKAARCALIRFSNSLMHVGGFTLRNGHTNGRFGEATSTDGRSNYGAAALCSAENTLAVQDCTVTGNVGVAIAYYAAMNRCRFRDNKGMTGTEAKADNRSIVGRGSVTCSVFEDNVHNNMRMTQATTALNCTYYCPKANNCLNNTSDSVYNAIIYTEDGTVQAPKNGCVVKGCMIWGTPTLGKGLTGYVKQNPRFSAPDVGDYRLNYNSPARAPVWTDDWQGGAITFNQAKLLSGDVDGNPLLVTEDASGNAKIALGALHSMGLKTGPAGMLIIFQ